jgi:hypothetical protein
VERPETLVPARHHDLVHRVLGPAAHDSARHARDGAVVSAADPAAAGDVLVAGGEDALYPRVARTGTLLVCPFAARVRGLDLLRDLSFDGLALAFLKHLEKVTFVSVPAAKGSSEKGSSEKGSSEKGSSDTGSSEKGSSETAARSTRRSTGLASAPHATDQGAGGEVSSETVSSQGGGGEAAAAASDTTASAAATLGTTLGSMLGATINEHRMEQTLIFDRGEAPEAPEAFGGDVAAVPIGAHEDAAAVAGAGGRSAVLGTDGGSSGVGGLGVGVLKGLHVVRHRLTQCTIIESVQSSAGAVSTVRRHYRLHKYTLHKHRAATAAAAGAVGSSGVNGSTAVNGSTGGASVASTTTPTAATTTIALAFPVSAEGVPVRSAEGEMVFAYLPVTAAGFGFGMHADFELVASRQDVSDSHSANHVLLGRIPKLFVHAILSDPILGEDAFPVYLPEMDR